MTTLMNGFDPTFYAQPINAPQTGANMPPQMMQNKMAQNKAGTGAEQKTNWWDKGDTGVPIGGTDEQGGWQIR